MPGSFFMTFFFIVGFWHWLFAGSQLPVDFSRYFLHPFADLSGGAINLTLKPKPEEQICPLPATLEPALKADSGSFDLSASSGLALDTEHNFYLYQKNIDSQLPIASISKLMAALVFLDHNPGWTTTYIIRADDRSDGNIPNLFSGEQVYIRDLFYSALVASDNSAISSLVHATGLSEADFVKAMNQKAVDLGMTKTNFVEPTGLSDYNVSTARDVAKLVEESMKDLDIRRAVLADKYELEILNAKANSKGKKNLRLIKNTDQLLTSKDLSIKLIGGKTGFIDKAGYCFAGSFTKDGQQIITVVLGAADPEARFAETEKMLTWIFNSYDWPKSINN
jgi:D-alanyl-D-alanine carboxypeptidase